MATTAKHAHGLGVLGKRGLLWKALPLKFAVSGRVTPDVFLRELDIAAPDVRDNRRLETVADGLPLFGGAQLAVDTTLVSPLHANGSPPWSPGD